MSKWNQPTVPTPARPLASVLEDLLHVLEDERRALRALDSERVEQATTRKLELAGQMIELAARGPLAVGDAEEIHRIQEELRINHLLLAHARNCVRDAIRAASGASVDSYAPPQQATPPAGNPAMRVDVRG